MFCSSSHLQYILYMVSLELISHESNPLHHTAHHNTYSNGAGCHGSLCWGSWLGEISLSRLALQIILHEWINGWFSTSLIELSWMDVKWSWLAPWLCFLFDLLQLCLFIISLGVDEFGSFGSDDWFRGGSQDVIDLFFLSSWVELVLRRLIFLGWIWPFHLLIITHLPKVLLANFSIGFIKPLSEGFFRVCCFTLPE